MNDTVALAAIEPAYTPLDEAFAEILGSGYLGGSSGPGGWSARSLVMTCMYKAHRASLPRGQDAIQRGHSEALEIGSLWHFLRAVDYGARIEHAGRVPCACKLKKLVPLMIASICTTCNGTGRAGPKAKCPACKRGIVRVPALCAPCALCEGRGWIPAPVFDTAQLRAQLLACKVNPDVVTEAYRLDEAYQAYYDNEPLRPLAVEIRAEAEGVSTRYDLIAEVVPNEANLPPGVWIVEHKTASRADVATLEGWQNDGQILGHMWIYHRAGLVKRYGPLAGVMVDVAVKTKVPQFYRIMVPVSMPRARAHVQDLRAWEGVYRMFDATGYFPRNRKSCIHFGRKCEFFDHCAEEP